MAHISSNRDLLSLWRGLLSPGCQSPPAPRRRALSRTRRPDVPRSLSPPCCPARQPTEPRDSPARRAQLTGHWGCRTLSRYEAFGQKPGAASPPPSSSQVRHRCACGQAMHWRAAVAKACPPASRAAAPGSTASRSIISPRRRACLWTRSKRGHAGARRLGDAAVAGLIAIPSMLPDSINTRPPFRSPCSRSKEESPCRVLRGCREGGRPSFGGAGGSESQRAISGSSAPELRWTAQVPCIYGNLAASCRRDR